jgi:thioredoxin 1
MVVEITEESKFIEKVADEKNGYVLVDFFAEWCGPCKRFSPTLEKLSQQWTNVAFYKVDVENLTHVAEEEKISSMPTFVLYYNGREVDRISGALEEKLVALLSKSKQL